VGDPNTRGAAVIAALVAVPVALIVGGVVFFSQHGRVVADAHASTAPTASATVSAAPVPVSAPSLTPAHATMCLAFIAQLPTKVRQLAQRPVTAGPEQNAAFGDPAITVTCGGPAPAVAATADLFNVSGVCWYPRQDKDALVLTTVDRETPVTVTVPNSYGDGQLQWASEFWKPIEATLPSIATSYHC
jgi:hypothetical protein